jgi:hypothetical protein
VGDAQQQISCAGRIFYLAMPTEALRDLWVNKISSQVAVAQAGVFLDIHRRQSRA